jgi:hypothetical protein
MSVHCCSWWARKRRTTARRQPVSIGQPPSRPRALINGEPTESTLALGTKGAMRVVRRRDAPPIGVSRAGDWRSHDSSPCWLNRTPATSTDPVLGPTTSTSGPFPEERDNVIAPGAEARLMARLVTPADEVLPLLERWAAGRASRERNYCPAGSAPHRWIPHVGCGAATDSVTDQLGHAVPRSRSVHVAHTDDEHVSITELNGAVGDYVRSPRPRRDSAVDRSSLWANTTK